MQLAGGNRGLGPVAYLERLENRTYVILHRRLSEIKRAGDRLVALSPRQEREYVELPFRQTQFGRPADTDAILGNLCWRSLPRGLHPARKSLRRNIDAAGEDQLQSAENDLARGRFGDEPDRAEIKCSYDAI